MAWVLGKPSVWGTNKKETGERRARAFDMAGVPDFSGERDAAEARVVLDDHFMVMLAGLDRGGRGYADARRILWFGEDDAAAVDRGVREARREQRDDDSGDGEGSGAHVHGGS